MSASNWAICPRCLRRAQAAKADALERAQTSYGKVSVAEFLWLRSEADKPIDREKLRTFREDWEVGVDVEAGTVYVSYRGGCSVCNLAIDFKDPERPLPGVDE